MTPLKIPATFDQNLYVDRSEVFQTLDDWLVTPFRDAPPEGERDGPVRVVVGAPGTGKTWTMRAYEEHLTHKMRGKVVVLYLRLPTDFPADPSAPSVINLSEDWINRAYEKVNKELGLSLHNGVLGKTQSLLFLVENVNAVLTNPGLLILIVDGYDEMPHPSRLEVDRQVLAPFVSQPCGRVIAAYRSECSFESFNLRLQQAQPDIVLETAAPFTDVETQYQKWLEMEKITSTPDWWTDCKLWRDGLPDYQWNHPFINAHLLANAYVDEKSPPRKLACEDIKACIEALVVRSNRFGRLSAEEFDNLERMANELPPEWASHELGTLLSVSSIAAINFIGSFFDRGMIDRNNDQPQRYKIGAGLYELLRAYRNLKTQEAGA